MWEGAMMLEDRSRGSLVGADMTPVSGACGLSRAGGDELGESKRLAY